MLILNPDLMARLTAVTSDCSRLERALLANTITPELERARRDDALRHIENLRRHLDALEAEIV